MRSSLRPWREIFYSLFRNRYQVLLGPEGHDVIGECV